MLRIQLKNILEFRFHVLLTPAPEILPRYLIACKAEQNRRIDYLKYMRSSRIQIHQRDLFDETSQSALKLRETGSECENEEVLESQSILQYLAICGVIEQGRSIYIEEKPVISCLASLGPSGVYDVGLALGVTNIRTSPSF